MAIAKMKKIMLIAPNRIQEELLEAVQELQALEVVPLQDGQAHLQANRTPSGELQALQKQKDAIGQSLQFLNTKVKQPSTWSKLRTRKETLTLKELEEKVASYDVPSLIQRVTDYQQQLRHYEEEAHELREKEALLRQWSSLDFHPKAIFQQSVTKTKMGTIPQASDNSYVNLLKESELVVVTEVYHSREEIGVFVTYPRSHDYEVKDLLAAAHFSITWYAFDEAPKEALQSNLARQQAVAQERLETLHALKEETELYYQLQLASDVCANDEAREAAKELLYSGNHLVCLEGYLTETTIQTVREQLQVHSLTPQVALVEVEIPESDYETVPTVLKNHKLIAPFEMLIEMYGLPKYGDVDPTPATAPFYLVFFGMMAADIGYGLILWLGTFAALKLFQFDKGTKRNLLFFHLLSYPTMLWGVIFGSFFGMDLPFQPLSLSRDLSTIMVLSIIFGVIQIIVGLTIGAYSNLKKKQYADAITSHIGWLAIIFGIILYIVGGILINQPIVATIGTYVAIIAAVAIVVATILTSENKFGGLAAGLYNLYGISGYVGDVVSYTRLMALAVSGGSIASAFNMLVSFLPPVARFTVGILLIAALHGLNIFLSFLGAYVHGLRLQFVEFYGKFYEGGGRALNPLKTVNDYVQVEPHHLNTQKPGDTPNK